MAGKIFFLPALFFSLFFIPSIFSSRSFSDDPQTTTVFDVSASMKQTLQLLSPESISIPLQEEKLDPKTKTHFSLSLHPRSSLIKTKHTDYKTLTLSRLERDSARVDSLTTKLEFAINGFNKIDLKPLVEESGIRTEALSTPVTSGISQGSGEYFARLGVGQPAKSFYLAVDTGSDVNWLQCNPCAECYQQTDPIYNPSESSTYSTLSCGSPQCSSLEISACRTDKCLYQVSYGDGSYTVGDFVTETVSFGNAGSFPNVAIGCGHDNEGLFTGSAGLLGLGGGTLSLPSQIKATSFSYCLVDRDSSRSSTLEFNSVRPVDSITAPLLRNSRVRTFFYVGLSGISVGGKPLSISPSVFQVDESGRGGIIVDSGTAVTRLQAEAYSALRDAFVGQAQNLRSTSGFALFDTCYDLSSMTQVAVPTVSFQFTGGKTLSLRPNNYLIPVDSGGKYCLAFAPTQGSLSIIGNVQQMGTRVSYDLANSVVSFSPNNC